MNHIDHNEVTVAAGWLLQYVIVQGINLRNSGDNWTQLEVNCEEEENLNENLDETLSDGSCHGITALHVDPAEAHI